MKRLISLAMVAAMAVSMVPTTAFAAVGSTTVGDGIYADQYLKTTASLNSTVAAVRTKGTSSIGVDDTDGRWDAYGWEADLGATNLGSGYIAGRNVPEIQIELGAINRSVSVTGGNSVGYYDISFTGGGIASEASKEDTDYTWSAKELNTLLSWNPTSDAAKSFVHTNEFGEEGATEGTSIYGFNLNKGGHGVGNSIWPGDGQAGLDIKDQEVVTNAPNIFVVENSIKTRVMRGTTVVTDFKVAVVYANDQDRRDTITEGDLLVIDVPVWFSSTGAGSEVWATVESEDFVIDSEIKLAQLTDAGFSASYYKTLDKIAPEERIYLSRDIDLTEIVADSFEDSQEVTLTLSRGFEFGASFTAAAALAPNFDDFTRDGNVMTAEIDGLTTNTSRRTISIDGTSGDDKGLCIEATTASVGDIATITIAIDGLDKQVIEVAEVVDYTVMMTVDTDKSVPVYYSGVNRNNAGLTVNHSHESLDVTIRETFPGAWDVSSGFTLSLPEGVYVVDEEDNSAGPSNGGGSGNGTGSYDSQVSDNSGAGVDMKEVQYITRDEDEVTAGGMTEIFKDAYERGSYDNFEFPRRPFDGNNHSLDEQYASITFSMFLTAEPSFEGPVDLTFTCNGVDEQTVTIAEFVKPFTVTAQQNDVIIDYRNTAINTTIVVEEYEAGLLDTSATGYLYDNADGKYKDKDKYTNEFNFYVDRGDIVQFETTTEFVIDDASDLTVNGGVNTGDNLNTASGIYFTITESSYDVPATITIDNIELFMQRSIPAGAYPLNMQTTMWELFADDATFGYNGSSSTLSGVGTLLESSGTTIVGGGDLTEEVHSNFVNVITAGSDVDNAFLTSIIVPIDANYIISGTRIISLDGDGITAATPPAYISNGYTMVPLRAVTEALNGEGINVEWNNDTRTVSIVYPSKVINMTVGENTYSVYGNSVPTSAALEIKNGRAFLPFRDLGKMLGVTDSNINWDETRRVAIVNGTSADIDRIYSELGL